MGPGRAAAMFSARNPDAERIRVTLFGSLALTGRGHGTDAAIEREVDRPGAVEIAWEPDKVLPRHPNGMRFEALRGGTVTDVWEVYSVGGGALWDEEGTFAGEKDIYPDAKMTDILNWCKAEGRTFVEYVELHEGAEIFDYLEEVCSLMEKSVPHYILHFTLSVNSPTNEG